jgi:hypothetical protein
MERVGGTYDGLDPVTDGSPSLVTIHGLSFSFSHSDMTPTQFVQMSGTGTSVPHRFASEQTSFLNDDQVWGSDPRPPYIDVRCIPSRLVLRCGSKFPGRRSQS